MRSRLLAAAAVGACLMASGASHATIVGYRFAAELETIYGPDDTAFPTALTGRFAYDTSVVDEDSASPTSAYYTGAAVGLAIDGYFEPPAFGPPQTSGDARVADDFVDILAWAARYDLAGGIELVVAFEFVGPPTVFSSDALPAALPLDQFTRATLDLNLVGDVLYAARYRLTALAQVPEPTGLFGVALLGLVGLLRGRRSRN